MNEATEIRAYLRAKGMKPSYLGLLACANPRAVERIFTGSASLGTLNKVMRFIKKNPTPEVTKA